MARSRAACALGDDLSQRSPPDDRRGVIKCYLGEGRFTDDELHTFGGVAVCEVPNLNGLMHYICKNGFEHHVALAQAECADVLEEAAGQLHGLGGLPPQLMSPALCPP